MNQITRTPLLFLSLVHLCVLAVQGWLLKTNTSSGCIMQDGKLSYLFSFLVKLSGALFLAAQESYSNPLGTIFFRMISSEL